MPLNHEIPSFGHRCPVSGRSVRPRDKLAGALDTYFHSWSYGGHCYRTTVARMGGRFFVPLNAVNREAAGVAAGDEVAAAIELDTAPRAVELPEDLKVSLSSDSVARKFFEQLSFTHRKEWVRWITEAKKN